MRKTKSIGIRLPIDLWKLVKTAEPELTYSEIVKRALMQKYNFYIDSYDLICEIIDGWE